MVRPAGGGEWLEPGLPVKPHQGAVASTDRIGAVRSNFAETLPEEDSPFAQELTRDPLILEFLGLTEPVRERDVEEAMTPTSPAPSSNP